MDEADFDRISVHTWRRAANGYAVRGKGGTTILMHREVARPGATQHVDHADGNRLNNCRGNLRPCTRGQNAANQAGHRRRKSRFKGVRQRTDKALTRPWEAWITVDRKPRFLGRFGTDTEAARAYDAAALENFGAFAQGNFVTAGA